MRSRISGYLEARPELGLPGLSAGLANETLARAMSWQWHYRHMAERMRQSMRRTPDPEWRARNAADRAFCIANAWKWRGKVRQIRAAEAASLQSMAPVFEAIRRAGE